MSPLDILAIALLAAGAAFVGTVSGFGFALLIVPPLSFVVGAKDAVVLSTVIGSVWLTFLALQLRRSVVWRTALPLTGAAFVGMPLGLLLLQAASAQLLQAIIGVNVLLATILLWRGVVSPWRGVAVDAAAGFVSGVLNTSTSMNGPPVVLSLQAQGMAPLPFRATLAAFFVASNVFGTLLFALAGRIGADAGWAVAAGLPGMALGLYGGNLVARRLEARRFRALVLGVLSVSACSALTRAALG